MLPLNMDVFVNPQTRLIIGIVGGVVFLILISMVCHFYRARIRKLAYLPAEERENYHILSGCLLLFDYTVFAFLAFILTAVLTALPLLGGGYLIAWLTGSPGFALPFLLAGIAFSLLLGLYVAYKFLRDKVILEESHALNTSNGAF